MSLQRLLAWSEAEGDLLAAYVEAFAFAGECRLSAALAEIQAISHDVADTIVRTAVELSAPSLVRLSRAPELEFRLRGVRSDVNGRLELATFLIEALRGELSRLRCETAEVHRGGLRSGDCNGAEVSLLGGEITVDFCGWRNRGDIERRFPNYRKLSSNEQHAVVAKIENAAELIAATSQQAWAFTSAFTTVIVGINVAGLDGQSGSFSSSWYPGRAVLINPCRMSVNEIAAALVHEAIHALVDVSELRGCLLQEPSAASSNVASPWTGAIISLQSLLDAYFVWYGLYWFWRRAASLATAPVAAARQRVNLARGGFVPELHDVIGEAISTVHPATVTAISELRASLAHTPSSDHPSPDLRRDARSESCQRPSRVQSV